MIHKETHTKQTEERVMRPFRLFVYGTLKRGYWNHEAYCGSAISVEEATVRGRLYELPSGIPVLKVPDESILALGTADASADVATQERVALPTNTPTAGEWLMIRGELMTFGDPSRDLPPIDRLESYMPGLFSLYRRVLVPMVSANEGIIAAWTYVGNDDVLRHCVPLEGSLWP